LQGNLGGYWKNSRVETNAEANQAIVLKWISIPRSVEEEPVPILPI
jgi:hypothetical protein